jgi:hypothetical protein
MACAANVKRGIVLLALLVCGSAPLSAQIDNQLSAYTGANATGYLQPLADAFGADLNAGIFRSASIPHLRPTIRLEVEAMSVFFGTDDKTFLAATEGDFLPRRRVSVPTVVGSEKAVLVDGDGGTTFAFPGGLALHSFALAAPQLRVGGLYGTEAIIRYFAIKVGGGDEGDSKDEDLGDIGLFGIGLKHDISQWIPAPLPVDLSAGFFWQTFTVGKNKKGGHLMESKALSIGVQASRKLAFFFVPYTGLSYDTHSMKVAYDGELGDKDTIVHIDFDRSATMHLTLGLMLDTPGMNVFGEYNIAGQSSFSFGVGLGF